MSTEEERSAAELEGSLRMGETVRIQEGTCPGCGRFVRSVKYRAAIYICEHVELIPDGQLKIRLHTCVRSN